MWAVVLNWVDEHLDQRIRVSLTANEDNGYTSATLVIVGVLGLSEDRWIAIEPPPGDVLTCTLGDGGLLLFEGTIEEVERTGPNLFVSMTGGDELVLSSLH